MSLRINKDADYDWLDNLETVDEIQEESVEIKEEPFDDDIKQEDIIYYSSDYIKNEATEIKEDFEDFADIKQDEFIFEGFNAIDNFKEDIKDEDLSTFPVVDIFCPSTGDSRPLTIDIDEGIHPKIQIAPLHPTIIKAPNTNTLNKTVKFKRLLKLCRFCNSSYLMGTEMSDHVRSKHFEEMTKMFQDKGFAKCAFCRSFFVMGSRMTNHVRTRHPTEWEKSTRQICVIVRKKMLDEIQSDCPPVKVFKKVSKRAQICDLCGKQASPYITSPQDPTSAQRFFDNLIELTPKQLETAQFFASRRVQVAICLSHYKNIERMSVELSKQNDQPTNALFEKNSSNERCQSVPLRAKEVPIEIKEEIDEFADIKQEEPIADVFCPSTGESRPSTIDIDKGMFARSDRPGPTIMTATKTITANRPHRATGRITKCSYCDCFCSDGSGMTNHLRSKHPEKYTIIKKQPIGLNSDGGVKFRLRQPCFGYASHEELVAANGLPFSAAQIVDMPLADLRKLLIVRADSLTESQRELIWKIRRRGKNNARLRGYRHFWNLLRRDNESGFEND